MLTLAREIRGLNQKELAEKVDSLNQGNLSKMERGMLKVPQETLIKIAIILKFPVSFFYQKEPKAVLNEIYYRKRKSTLRKPLKNFEANRNLIVRLVDNLMNDLEMSDCDIPRIDLERGFTPQVVARKVREYIQIPTGPIHNIVNALEKKGVIIQLIEAPNKVDGCTIISDNLIPIIFVNDNHPPDKQRFTIVHELGHLVMHLNFIVPEYRDVETEANEFAAEFLMPARDCLSDLNYLTFSKLPDIKAYWGVSYATAIRRAFDLGKISESKKKSLYIQRSQLGYIKSEPNCGVMLSKPVLLNHIVNFYIKELNYTINELCEALHVGKDDFDRLMLNKKVSHLQISHKNQKRTKSTENYLDRETKMG